MSKKIALGRGLDALLGTPGAPAKESSPETPLQPPAPAGTILIDLAVEEVDPNPEQPRLHFDPEKLGELAQSIQSQGLIQPIVVRKSGDRYQLIAGERRLRAAKLAGFASIPARILEVDDEDNLEKSLVENIQRENLNPIHEARAYQNLKDKYGLTQDQIAQKVGKNRATVANTMRLLRLPEEIQSDLLNDRLSEGHARALLQLDDGVEQLNIRDRILRSGLSVRDTEKAVTAARSRPGGRKSGAKRGAAVASPALLREIEEKLTLALGTRVKIQARSARKGRIIIPYASLEDFERITGLLGVESE